VHTARYTIVLHVALIPEELAVARVAYRVQSGGHPVAENKIRGRYRRLWTLVAEEIDQCRQTKIMTTAASKARRSRPRKAKASSSSTPPRLRTRHCLHGNHAGRQGGFAARIARVSGLPPASLAAVCPAMATAAGRLGYNRMIGELDRLHQRDPRLPVASVGPAAKFDSQSLAALTAASDGTEYRYCWVIADLPNLSPVANPDPVHRRSQSGGSCVSEESTSGVSCDSLESFSRWSAPLFACAPDQCFRCRRSLAPWHCLPVADNPCQTMLPEIRHLDESQRAITECDSSQCAPSLADMTVAPCTGCPCDPLTPVAGVDHRGWSHGTGKGWFVYQYSGTPDTGEGTQYRKGSDGMSTIAVIGATGTAGSLVTNKLKSQDVTVVEISRSLEST